MNQDYKKLLISARYFLTGAASQNKNYLLPLKMFEISQKFHNGVRKNGEHEFIHQLSIFHTLRTFLPYLRSPHLVLALVFAHDLLEDFYFTQQTFKELLIENDISLNDAIQLIHLTESISKKFKANYFLDEELENASSYPNKQYSLEIVFENPILSVVKLADRNHNISTMCEAFSIKKMQDYIYETEHEFIPLIKIARRLFPDQEPIYEALKLSIQSSIRPINFFIQKDKK